MTQGMNIMIAPDTSKFIAKTYAFIIKSRPFVIKTAKLISNLQEVTKKDLMEGANLSSQFLQLGITKTDRKGWASKVKWVERQRLAF